VSADRHRLQGGVRQRSRHAAVAWHRAVAVSADPPHRARQRHRPVGVGLKVIEESPGFLRLGERPDALGLGLGMHSEVHGRDMDPARHMVRFMSDDTKADWRRLKEAGVEFMEDLNVAEVVPMLLTPSANQGGTGRNQD